MENSRPGFNCQHGQMYEVKLLMLCVARATKLVKENVIRDFECATNVEGYGIYDDLVSTIHYVDTDGNMKEKTICFQAKHSLNTTREVNVIDMKNENSKWSLKKIIESHNEVKLNHDEYTLILYTNNVFEKEITTCANIDVEKANMVESTENLAYQVLGTSKTPNESIRFINESNRNFPEFFQSLNTTENFMKDVVIFCNQSSENELDDIIKSIIIDLYPDQPTKDNIDEIFNEMLTQFNRKWMCGESISNKVNEIEKIRTKVLLTIEQNYFRQKFQDVNLEFNGISNIIDELYKKGENLIKINSACIDLSTKKIDSYCRKNDKETIIIRKDLFIKLLPALLNNREDKRDSVFIIYCQSYNEKIDEETEKLLEKHSNTKIIIISILQENSICDQFNLNELTEDSRHFLLGKMVSFQGHAVKLKNLLHSHQEFQFDSLTLKLLLENELQIGDHLESFNDIYIPRKLKQPYFGMEILDDPYLKDIIFVVADSEDEIVKFLGKNRRYSLCNNIDITNSNIIIHRSNCQDYNEEYKSFCKNHEKNVHLFKKIGSSLKWEKSSGDVSILDRYVEKEPIILSEDEFITNIKDKSITVISDEVGTGKSVLLTNIANKIKTKNPEYLVLKVNLNSITPSLKSIEINPTISCREIINKLTNSDNIIVNHIISNARKNVVVLLDGFDEICPTYNTPVTRIIQILISNEISVVLTSRPSMIDHLKRTFSSIAYNIEYLSIQEQVELIKKYWKQISVSGKNEEINLENLLQELYENFKETEFFGSPLFTRILATYEYENIEMTEENQISYNIYTVYKEFILNLINQYYKKLNYTNQPIFDIKCRTNTIYSKLTSLSLLSISNKLDALPDLRSEQTTILKDDLFIEECKRIGIIATTRTNTLVFLHQTLAEFLLTEYFINQIQHENANVINFIFGNPRLKPVRILLDYILSKNERNIFSNIEALGQSLMSCTENLISISVSEGNVNIFHILLTCFQNCKYDITKLVFDLNKDGYNCLHLICETKTRRNVEIVRTICNLPNIEKYINMYSTIQNTRSLHENCSALLFATYHGLTEIVKILIGNNAYVNGKSSSGNSALMFAAKNGDNDLVTLLLDRGVKINISNGHGDTALMFAASKGDIDVVKTLLDRRAVTNFRDNNGDTALMIATQKGNNDVVKLLLERGADFNVRSKNGDTALLAAYRYGNNDVVKLLLQRGADINVKNKNRDTALMLASSKCSYDVVTSLLVHGADVNVSNNDGYTALMLAAENGNNDVVTTLLHRGADVNIGNIKGVTALMLASSNGNNDVVTTLLDRGADINFTSKNHDTALICAATRNKHDVIKTLLDRGADINVSNKHGNTALICAAEYGSNDVVTLLLDRGADVNARDNYDETVLIIAAGNGKYDMVITFLDRGANINACTKVGNTALMFASWKGKNDAVTALLDRGADVNVSNEYGYTALIFVAKNGSEDVATTLLDRGADINVSNKVGATALMFAIKNYNTDLFTLLLDRGIDINVRNNHGVTALMLALAITLVKEDDDDDAYDNGSECSELSFEYDEIMELEKQHLKTKEDQARTLMDRGAEINVINNDGDTALMIAAKHGCIEAVRNLIARGADVNISNNNGETALMLAAKYGSNQAVRTLLARDADVNVSNNGGDTSKAGNVNIIFMLLQAGADRNIKNKENKTAVDLVDNNCVDIAVTLFELIEDLC